MGTYELDDDLVRRFVAAQDKAGWGNAVADELASRLSDQIPVPIPEHTGAVVRTDTGVYMRWTYDNHSHSPWILAGDHETPLRTDEIGRIAEVLAPGVEY